MIRSAGAEGLSGGAGPQADPAQRAERSRLYARREIRVLRERLFVRLHCDDAGRQSGNPHGYRFTMARAPERDHGTEMVYGATGQRSCGDPV